MRLREIRPSERDEPHRKSYAAIMGAAPPKRADVMLKQPNGCIALSAPISDRTERIPGRQDTETDQSEMRPIVSTFGKNIVVNRAQQDQKETNEMMV